MTAVNRTWPTPANALPPGGPSSLCTGVVRGGARFAAFGRFAFPPPCTPPGPPRTAQVRVRPTRSARASAPGFRSVAPPPFPSPVPLTAAVIFSGPPDSRPLLPLPPPLHPPAYPSTP